MRGIVRVGCEADLGAEVFTCRNEIEFVEHLWPAVLYLGRISLLLVAVATGAAPQSPVCGIRGPDCPSSRVAFHRFISTCATQKAPQLHHHFGFCGLGTHNNKLFHEIMILVSFVRGCGSLADQL